MLISDAFDLIQGHQITDEEIYNAPAPIYPIYTGNNELKGYWDKYLVKDVADLPCITYPTKANAGVAFVQESAFDANNTAVLKIKKVFRKKIRLEWMVYRLPPLFLDVMTSKEGVSYLSRRSVEKLEFDLPTVKVQDAEILLMRRLTALKGKLSAAMLEVDALLAKHHSG